MTDQNTKPAKFKLFERVYNPLSLMGIALCAFSAAMIVALLVIDLLVGTNAPYLGLITFLILPPFFFLGLLIIPIGAYRYHRKLHREGIVEQPHFKLDLNLAHHRKNFVLFLLLTFCILILVGTLSYEGYHYTESTQFCGTCHSVMEPESTTHQLGSHARVACTACHVGEGASWYVKSKLSGLYQVYSVFAKKYPRPIATPIHNLRPARDICEKCHWPDFFAEDKLLNYRYFLSDEDNAEGFVTLLMKIGGRPNFGQPSGIHWHIQNRVRFIAQDEKNEEIVWVEVEDHQGNTTVYRQEDWDESGLASSEIHTMDCMDCHNRPAHEYQSPTRLMNAMLHSGAIDQEIPGIRALGAELLAKTYDTREEAHLAIRQGLSDLDEDVRDSFEPSIEKAKESLIAAYDQNFFPYMKTRWDVHASNIGHMTSPGCFRCHNDQLQNEQGAVIQRDCNHCHLILAQGSGSVVSHYDPKGLPFQHPDPEDEGEWEEESCHSCHTGGE